MFERTVRQGIRCWIPANGRRVISLDDVERKFTGVALASSRAKRSSRAPPVKPLRRYLHRLASHWRVLGQVLLQPLLLQAFVLALPLLMSTIVDGIVPRGDRGLLGVLALGVGIILAFSFLRRPASFAALGPRAGAAGHQLGIGFVDHLTRLPYAFFLRRSAGDLLARFQSNRELRETLTTRAITSLLDGALVLFYLVALMWTSVPSAASCSAWESCTWRCSCAAAGKS